MISPRKHWCQDLDCFIKSDQNFYTLEYFPSLNQMKKRKEWQFKVILSSRLTIDNPKCKIYLIQILIHKVVNY